MIDLGERRHVALAAPATGALLDGDGGRNAEDRIDVGTRGRLHELPGIGVQRLEVTTLALVEEDVEGERRLARARDAGDHRKAIARYLHVDPLEVVLAGLVDDDRAAPAPVAAVVAGRRLRHHRRGLIRPVRLTRERPRVSLERTPGVRGAHGAQLQRRAARDDLPAALTALGT